MAGGAESFFGAIKDQEVRGRANVIALPGSPDAAGRANALAREMGLPADTVERNLGEVERRAQAARAGSLISRYPAIGTFTADPRNAAVARDDLGGLASIAKSVGGFLESAGRSLPAGVLDLTSGLYGAARAGAEISAEYNPGSWLQRKAFGTSVDDTLARFFRSQQQSGATMAEGVAGAPLENRWARDVVSGFRSVPGSVSALALSAAGMPQVAVGILGTSVGGGEYGRARDKNIAPLPAAVYGASQGLVEFATERVPALRYFNDTQLGASFARKLFNNVAKEVPQEQIATVLQDMNEWAVLNPEKTLSEFLAERPDRALSTLIATAAGASITVSSVEAGRTAVERIGRRGRELEEAQRAEAGARFIEKLMADSAGSKVRPRDVTAWERFLELNTQGTAVENVHVPAERVAEYLQSQNIDWHDSDSWWGSEEGLSQQIDEALATGGDVVIPTAKAAAHLAGTPAWEALKDHARLSPGGLSPFEARSLDESYERDLQEMGEKFSSQIEESRAELEPVQKLYQSIRDKLTNAGFTQSAADTNAQLVSQRYATRASRLGLEVTGSEFDDVAVNQVLPERLAPIVAADQLDLVVEAMRRGRGQRTDSQRFGLSLLEWIAKRGGVEDRGGDIASMGGNDWHKARPFRKRLIREAAQPGMLDQATGNANTSDALALEAQEAGYLPIGDRPTVQDLLDAISEELGGTARYAEDRTEQGDMLRAAADDLAALLDQQGVDPDTASPADIRKFVQRYQTERSEGRGYDQTFADGPRGRITFTGERSVIDLFAERDLSTFIHESGHLFLEELMADAAQAPVRLYRAQGDKSGSRQGIDTTDVALWFTTDLDIAANYASKRSGEVFYLDVSPERAAALLAGRNTANILEVEAAGMRQFTSLANMRREAMTNGFALTPTEVLNHVRAAVPADGSVQIKADAQAVRDWFEANGHDLSNGIPVDAHEMWARGFERYAMEGKSPSSVLRKAFDTFRSWLLSIYKLVDNLRAPITPEIRAVMDRLIATDEEIEAAAEQQSIKALFADAAQAGMTEAEFGAYRQATEETRSEAFDALLYRTMETIRRQRTKAWKDEEASVKADVTERVARRPEFRALKALRAKEPRIKLDRAWVVETYGEDALALLPKGVPPIYSDRGTTSADTVAEMHGFATGDDMVRMLMGVEQRTRELREGGDKRSVRQALIDEETAATMLERHGDILADGSIEEEALAAIHSDRQGEVIASELRALSRRANQQPTPYQLARQWAARTIAESRVVDATSGAAMQRYAKAAAKAGREAEAAMLAGNIDETFRQKQRQMLNNALIAEAKKAKDQVDAAVSMLGKLAKRATIKSVDQDYLDQAHALLEQVDFRVASQRLLDRKESFEEWVGARTEEGHDLVVPPSFAERLGTTHWSRLSVENLLGLDEAVKQVVHLGRLKQRLLDGQEEREFRDVRAEGLGQIDKLPPKPPSNNMAPTPWENAKSAIRSLDAMLLKIEQVVDWLDNGNSNGLFNRVVFGRIAEAQTRERDMLKDYVARMDAVMKAVPKKQVADWARRLTTPELLNRETGEPWVLTKEQIVSIALNTGNEGNYQRLLDGYGWSDAGVQAVLDRLMTAEDWAFVQGTWDTIDTLWPEAAAMWRRVNGVEPPKIEARPISNRHGEFRGGYFPAIYDPLKDSVTEQQSERSGDALFDNGYSRATTAAGSSKERATDIKRPIMLSIGVIHQHIGEVVHDITHREAVIAADRLMSDPQIQKAIAGTLGPEYGKMFRPWLQHVANEWANDKKTPAIADKILKGLRTRTTIVGLGYRASTVLAQYAGYSNVVAEIGVKWWAVGNALAVKNPAAAYREVMEKSGEMRGRFGSLDRDIRENARKYASQRGLRGVGAEARRFAFYGIGLADQTITVPAWIGAYNKALAVNMSEADAVAAADKVIRQSQGAGAAKDIAAIMRSHEGVRMFTIFYSYFSALYARQRNLGRDWRHAGVRDVPMLVARSWWLLIMPNLLSLWIKGDEPDDDENYGWWLARKLLIGNLASIPGVREIAGALDTGFGYKLSPNSRPGEVLVQSAKDIGKALDPDEEASDKWLKNSLTTAGYVLGQGLGAPATAAQFMLDVANGEEDPEGVAEWWRGVTTGTSEEE